MEADFDPDVFGLWPKAPVYDGLREDRWERLADVADQVVLDTKAQTAGSALDDLQDMLNGMTKELKQQLQQFQVLRRAAEATLAEEGGEIDRKTVQADAKASLEAMSLIIRTLEKIDSLQRTIAHDRQAEADRTDENLEALVAEFDARVERRAGELFRQRWAEGKSAEGAEDGGGGAQGRGGGGAALGPDGDGKGVG